MVLYVLWQQLWHRICRIRVAMPAPQQKTIGSFWKQFPDARGQVRHPATCRLLLATGTANYAGSGDRPSPAYSRDFSMLWALIPTANVHSLMSQSFRSTRRQRGQLGDSSSATGRSRGVLTTKLVALADALGNLVRFLLLPGQEHNVTGVAPLIRGVNLRTYSGTKCSMRIGCCKTSANADQALRSRPKLTEKFIATITQR